MDEQGLGSQQEQQSEASCTFTAATSAPHENQTRNALVFFSSSGKREQGRRCADFEADRVKNARASLEELEERGTDVGKTSEGRGAHGHGVKAADRHLQKP